MLFSTLRTANRQKQPTGWFELPRANLGENTIELITSV